MEIHFLGTAASEGIPNVFCSCEICEQARSAPGKHRRTRSSALIDGRIQIDIAPDFTCQLLRDGADARKITHLLFTHTHPDHFNIGDLYSRMVGFGHGINQTLNLCGNDIAISECARLLSGYSQERFKLNLAVPFVTIERGGYRITPLLANHAVWEFCYVWFIEKDGKSLFYGHDSGWFPELTWQWLAGKHIDLTVLECTLGFNGETQPNNHMSIEAILAAQEKLKDLGCHNKNSQLVLSHISHNVKMNHQQLEEFMLSHGILVAWDGLKMEI